VRRTFWNPAHLDRALIRNRYVSDVEHWCNKNQRPINIRRQQRLAPAILARARELRRELTPQERKLWALLHRKGLFGLKFRREHALGRFIAEPNQQAYDQARTRWLNDHDVQVIRFTNHEIDTTIEGVLDEIARACGVEVAPL